MTKNTITQEQVNKIFDEANKEYIVRFDKCLILICQLKNGFVIVEDASCVDPKNFDFNIGTDIANERVMNKIWELEAYKLSEQIKGE